MRRDRMTFAIMFGLPIVQILLFGFVINSDPRHLPTAALLADNGAEGRTLLQGLKNSTYFDFVRLVGTEQEGRSLLTRGEVQFVINIPQNFSHDLLRGDKPAILLEADATDPIATSGGAGALANIIDTAFQSDFVGPLEFLASAARSIDIRVHSLYNPEAITSYNIVPGLMGVVLTMTMVMVTALAITREYERGTMENLLSCRFARVKCSSERLRLTYSCVMFRLGSSFLWRISYLKFQSTGISSSCFWPRSFLSPRTLRLELHFRRWRVTSCKRCKWRCLCSSFDSTVRIPVPISRDAMVGAGSWRDLADHPFSPHRARSYVEGDRFCRRRT